MKVRPAKVKRKKLRVEDIPTIRYAVHSKKGFSRATPKKPNQDSFIVKENLTYDNCHLFSVLDGHGQDGHFCSQFVKEDLPR